jgi:hypothetical protein
VPDVVEALLDCAASLHWDAVEEMREDEDEEEEGGGGAGDGGGGGGERREEDAAACARLQDTVARLVCANTRRAALLAGKP